MQIIFSGKTSAVSGKSTPASSGGSEKKPRKRHFLGQLSVDRQYLENLLQHPGNNQIFIQISENLIYVSADIKTADEGLARTISAHATEGVAFLKRRQHFWRQQCPNVDATPAKNWKSFLKPFICLIRCWEL